MTSSNVAGTPRVTFHTCLHDDGDALWLQFEGGTASPSTPEEFQAFLREEVSRWEKMVKQTRITVE